MPGAKEGAENFLDYEKQFHLGVLLTEQPHPKTANFSQTIQNSTEEGVRNFLEVDQDIPSVAERVLTSQEYQQLVEAFLQCVDDKHRICFSGCGASGRVAIILEAMWRSCWQKAAEHIPEKGEEYASFGDHVLSIMTGGDRALIRSVENFEDYQVFGRRQVIDADLGKNDVLIAMSEGGVVSSVIGTAKEAYERGTKVFLIFNNPKEILTRHIQRSREVIDIEEIIHFDLTTGHMALSGSTRLQTTSIAMLILSAAMEECIATIISRDYPAYIHEIQSVPLSNIRNSYAAFFKELVDQLSTERAVSGLSRFVDLEAEMYSHQGLVTYIAAQYLLDIFSDTTERTPTFMIPPFHQYDELTAPEPWAFAKDPLHPSQEAWHKLLKREARGLNWTQQDYQTMGVQEEIIQNPPLLTNDEIYKFQIGYEDDAARYNSLKSALIWVFFEEDIDQQFQEYFTRNMANYTHPTLVTMGSSSFTLPGAETIHIPLALPRTCCDLFYHIAVKLVFNTLSTATMGKMGRILGNWMVQVDATNKKLTDRAIRIISHIAKIPYEQACYELFTTMENPEINRLQFKESYVIQTFRRLGVELNSEKT